VRYAQLLTDRQIETMFGEFKERREEFLEEVRRLRPRAEQIEREYAELSRDDAIKKALDALRLPKEARLGLGPSPEFKKQSTRLKRAEKEFSPESLTRKRPSKAKKGKRDMPPASGKRVAPSE
jgi:hypothetical protein